MSPVSALTVLALFLAVPAVHAQKSAIEQTPDVDLGPSGLEEADTGLSRAVNDVKTASSVPAAPEASAPMGAAPTARPVMPPLPSGVQRDLNHLGVLTLNYKAVDLQEALRPVVRLLDRPLHVSATRAYAITGNWKDATAIQVLRDIATSSALSLRETPSAYLLDEGATALAVPSAAVAAPARSAAAVAMLYADDELVQSVKPLEGQQREKFLGEVEAKRRKVLREREAISRMATP